MGDEFEKIDIPVAHRLVDDGVVVVIVSVIGLWSSGGRQLIKFGMRKVLHAISSLKLKGKINWAVLYF